VRKNDKKGLTARNGGLKHNFIKKHEGQCIRREIWMAGSILGKLRGFYAKTRTKTALILNRDGLRVDLAETEGLLCKAVTVDRYVLC